jgi:hypothetical protein
MVPDDKPQQPKPDDAGKTQRFDPFSADEIAEDEAAERTRQIPGGEANAPPASREATVRYDPLAAPSPREATARYGPEQVAPPGREPSWLEDANDDRTSVMPGLEQRHAGRQGPAPSSVEPPAAGDAGDSGILLEESGSKLATRAERGAIGEITTSQRPLIEELEKPYSLQPEEVESPELAAREAARRGLTRPMLGLIGVGVGLALCALVYFLPRSPSFQFEKPETAPLAELRPIAGAAPPRQWVSAGGLFFGIDADSRPWNYDPTSGVATRSAASAPAVLGTQDGFSVVARPPLDLRTRLAWIEPASDGGAPRLVCRDYEFVTDSADAANSLPAGQPVNVSIDLPAGDYRYAPAVVDHPDPKTGLRLVTVDAQGAVTGWAPLAEDPSKPAWQHQAGSPPAHEPLVWIDFQSQPPAEYVLVLTEKGVETLDGATGQSVGRLEWSMRPGHPLGVARMQPVGGAAAWVASDGQGGLAFALARGGRPEKLAAFTIAEDLGAGQEAPRLVTFPSGAQPDADDVVVASAGGRLAWLVAPAADQAAKPVIIQSATTGTLAATDLSGDGYYDLVGLDAAGQPWLADGRRHAAAHQDAATTRGDAARAPTSPVSWRLTRMALVGEYFDAQGTPLRVSLSLPTAVTADSSRTERLVQDWRRRNGD